MTEKTVQNVDAVPFILDQDTNSVLVAYWDSPAYSPNVTEKKFPFQIDICDQRKTNGQLYVDVGSSEGDLDNFLSSTFEINKITEDGPEMPTMHLHFDGDNMAASFFKMNDHFLVRLENQVVVENVTLPDGTRGLKIY